MSCLVRRALSHRCCAMRLIPTCKIIDRHCERSEAIQSPCRSLWIGRVGAEDCSSAPLTEPDLRASHTALWIDLSKGQQEYSAYDSARRGTVVVIARR